MKALRKYVRALRLLAILFFLSNCRLAIYAQDHPDFEVGARPFGSYKDGNIDHINLFNGHADIVIPIISYPQRGNHPPLVFGVKYQNLGYWQDWSCRSTGGVGFWGFLQPNGAICTPTNIFLTPYASGFKLVELSGGGGPGGNGISLGCVGAAQDPNTHQYVSYNCTGGAIESDGAVHQLAPVSATTWVAIDGSGYRLDFNGNIINSPSTVLTNADGVRLWTDPTSQVNHARIYREDRNGNRITWDQPGYLDTTSGYTDTIGRHIPDLMGAWSAGFLNWDNSNFTQPGDTTHCSGPLPIAYAFTWSPPGSNGGTYPIKFCYVDIVETLPAVPIPGAPQPATPVDTKIFGGMLQSIVLPDSTTWTFEYTTDGIADLAKVTFPTGGTLSYVWTSPPRRATVNGVGPSFLFTRGIASRTLNGNNGEPPATTFYSYSNSSPVTTETRNGNDTVHTFALLGFQSEETQTKFYQGSSLGTPLKTINKEYVGLTPSVAPAQYTSSDVVLSAETTILANGLQSRVEYDYDSTAINFSGLVSSLPPVVQVDLSGNFVTQSITTGKYRKRIATRVYDYGINGPGPLLKQTVTPLVWAAATNPGGPCPYNITSNNLNRSAYFSSNFLNLVDSEQIQDGTCAIKAKTTFGYDESSLQPSGVTTQINANPPSGLLRGNRTTTGRWLNTTNSFVTSQIKWYDTGEKYQDVDPLVHATTYSYDLAYAGAYLTQTCSPQTSSVQHCISSTYDLNSGLLTSLTNENATAQASGNVPGDSAHTSNYTYDLLLRLISEQAPPDPSNGGLRAQNGLVFSPPNTFPVSAQQSKSVTATLSDVTTSFFDGLGRVYKSQHTLPNGTATVDTTFDLAGHPATVSNPYFSTGDPTYGILSNVFDALDRVTQTTKQDGSISKIRYNATTTIPTNSDCTISTDEAGNQRGACTDALGRLLEIDEPNPSSIFNVNYHATMQTDGNFVLSNTSGVALWATGPGNGVIIEMQDDGNLVEYHQLWQAGTYRVPNGATVPYDACSIGPVLNTGGILHDGQCLESHSGVTFAVMTNGDLQIYDRQLGQITWHSNTYGHAGGYATLQSDGNFVVYDANNNALWSAGTFGASLAELEDDARLIIYNPVWWSGTSQGFGPGSYTHPSCDAGIGTGWTGVLGSGQCFVSRNGRYELLIQTDGNMVIYDRSVTPNAALWSTGTNVSPADPGFALRTLYTYDVLGNLTCVEQHGDATTGTGCSADPSNDATSPWRVRRFTYDSLSRLLTAKNPESGTISYAYDNDGNLLQKTSPAPNQTGTATQTISYCYDELHRVTGRTYGALSCPLASPVVSYTYDTGTNAKGLLVSMTDQAGTATYGYDILGRLITETHTLTGANNAVISKTVSYEHNLDGSLKSLHYPSGAVVTYTPDSVGRVMSAVDTVNNINYVSGATYGPDSSLTSFLSGSGGSATITNKFFYTPRQQPCRMAAATNGTLPGSCVDPVHGNVLDLGYDFHAGNGTPNSGMDNGNIYGIFNYRDHSRDQSFTYDSLNRVLTAQNAGTNCSATTVNGKTEYWGNSYSYDAWGNLLSKIITKCGAENLSLTADAHNWIHAGGTDYRYDAAGNMTFDATSGLSYAFDQENRLTGAAGYTYTYDGDGNRVCSASGTGNGTLYWYMNHAIVAESDLLGNLGSEYIFFNGKRISRRDLGTNTVSYYLADKLGTISPVIGSSGTITAESDHYPWGGELQLINNDPNRYKFDGKPRDPETELDYFGARYYSNRFGRFISPDWSATPEPVPYASVADPQSLNLYSFVHNDPTSLSDPDGHCTKDGETHNWLWCTAHWFGVTETQKEHREAVHKKAEEARKFLSGVKLIDINGKTPAEFAKGLTDEQAIEAEDAISRIIIGIALDNPCGYHPGIDFKCGIVFPVDFASSKTINWSAEFESEGEARAFARTKLGKGAVEVEPHKWRSADGRWQYRAKPGDVADGHIHLEKIDPFTGEVLQNLHLRWKPGTER